MNRLLLAEAMGRRPGSSEFRDLIAASSKYGFTSGNFTSETIALEALGERLTKPRSETERLEALRTGLRQIPFFESVLQHYNNNRLPEEGFLKNAFERAPFNLAPEWSGEAARVFTENGREVGFVRDVGGRPHVILEAGAPTDGAPKSARIEHAVEESAEPEAQPSRHDTAPAPAADEMTPAADGGSEPEQQTLQFLICHGSDRSALEEVEKILDGFGIPYIVAVEEPNAGRPISQKVKELMDACTGGIFIFSADEEFRDLSGETIFKPRENVIYELGAASYKYDRRIVIFKDSRVTLPSDFRDLGYISYEEGQLASHAMELLRELIALKAIKLSPGG